MHCLKRKKFGVLMQIVIVFFLKSTGVIYCLSDNLLQTYLVFVGLSNDLMKSKSMLMVQIRAKKWLVQVFFVGRTECVVLLARD